MTGDTSTNLTSIGMSSLTWSRLRALLLVALESPPEDGTQVDGGAGASRLLAALGTMVLPAAPCSPSMFCVITEVTSPDLARPASAA
jgi:hypothetical protein